MGTIIFEHKNAKRFNEQIATFHVIMKNVLMRNVAMIHSLSRLAIALIFYIHIFIVGSDRDSVLVLNSENYT